MKADELRIDDARFTVHTRPMAILAAAKPTAVRLAHAGLISAENLHSTKIDRWFLVQTKEIVNFNEELAGAEN